MKTSAFLGARYTGLIGATKKPEVHAISGFALAPLKKILPENLSDFSRLREFEGLGVKKLPGGNS